MRVLPDGSLDGLLHALMATDNNISDGLSGPFVGLLARTVRWMVLPNSLPQLTKTLQRVASLTAIYGKPAKIIPAENPDNECNPESI